MSALMRCSRLTGVLYRSVTNTGHFSANTRHIGHNVLTKQSQLTCIAVAPSHKEDKKVWRNFSTEAQGKVNDVVAVPENYPATGHWKYFQFDGLRIQSNTFNTAYKNIDMRVRSNRGLSALEFYHFMKLVDQKDTFTSEEAYLILKCCGHSNRVVRKAECIAWTDYLMNKFRSTGVTLSTLHFNQMLANYQCHDHAYSPTEFLTELEKTNIVPDRVMLGKFVQRYCRLGDMNSASKILEHMKMSDMAISLPVYNSLIMGHFKAGDAETAMKLFHDAKNIGFDLDATTFYVAIIGQACEEQDMAAVKELFVLAQEENVIFSDGAYSSMIEKVAEKGLTEFFEYFLSMLKAATTFYYNEAQDTLITLLSQGNYEYAYSYFEGLTDPSGRIFFKAAILADMPVEETVKYSRLMKSQGRRLVSLADCLDCSLVTWSFDYGAALLSYFEKEGEELRPQYIWPSMCNCRTMNDLETLKTILPLCFADRMTIVDYLNPILKELGVSDEEYPQFLKEHCTRFTQAQINTCVLEKIIRTEGLEAALAAVEKFDKLASVKDDQSQDSLTFSIFQKIYKGTEDWRTVIKLLNEITSKMDSTLLYQNIIVAVARGMQEKGEPLEELKDCLLQGGLKISVERLNQAGLKSITSEQEMEQLTVDRTMYSYKMLNEMSIEDVEKLYRSNGSAFCATFLANHYFREKDWPAFEAMVSEIDVKRNKNRNFHANLAQHYMYRKDDPVFAGRCLFNWKSLTSGEDRKMQRGLPFHLVFNTASGLAKRGHHADARELLSLIDDGVSHAILKPTKCYLFEDPSLSKEEAYELFDQLMEFKKKVVETEIHNYRNSIVKGLTNFIAKRAMLKSSFLASYIENIMENSICDYDEISEFVETLDKKYNIQSFNPMPLFIPIIQKDNKVLLQKVFNLLSETQSEKTLLITLAASFVDEGKMAQARKVLATPGLGADDIVLNRYICDPWVQEDKTEVLEKFYSLVKDLRSVSKKTVLFSIFRSLCRFQAGKVVDVERCIQFFDTRFEEENVAIDRSMFRYYAKFLSSNGHEVPFTVDETPTRQNRDRATSTRQNPEWESKIERRPMEDKQPATKEFGPSPLFTAIESGEMDNIMGVLELSNRYLSGQEIKQLDEKNPELIKTYAAACEQMSKSKNKHMEALYNFYILEGRLDEAAETQKQFNNEEPSFFVLQRVSNMLSRTNKIEILEKMFESDMVKHPIGKVIQVRGLLAWYVKNLDLTSVESLDRIDSVFAKIGDGVKITREDITRNISDIFITKLESEYEMQNRKLPWTTDGIKPTEEAKPDTETLTDV